MIEKFDDFLAAENVPLEQSLAEYAREVLDTTQAVVLDKDGNIYIFTGNVSCSAKIVSEWLNSPTEQHARAAFDYTVRLKTWRNDGIQRDIIFNYVRKYEVVELGTTVYLEEAPCTTSK